MLTPRLASVYIAAPWPCQALARELRDTLVYFGWQVIARWIDMPGPAVDTAEHARMDLDDIDAADDVVLLNPPGWENTGTGGRHFETGYAYHAGKRLILLGVRSHVFHALEAVVQVEDIAAVMTQLQRWDRERQRQRADLVRRLDTMGEHR